MSYPEKCDLCRKDRINSNLFSGNIELKVKPVKGEKPSIIIIGQDPTITKREVSSVLDLYNSNGLLYKFIIYDILEPAGFEFNNIYATNLIKCTFPDNQTPKTIAEKYDISMTDFLRPFSRNCKRWLEREVNEIRPKIILSLGEPVHKLLVEEYNWKVPEKMKEAFSNIYKIKILNMEVSYVPCIHINSKHHEHYNKLWSVFIKNLSRTKT